MDLKNFLRVLLRRRWLILAITSLAMITTFIIAGRAPSVYKATVRISTGISETGDMASAPGTQDQPRYEIEARYKNLEEVMRSPQVLDLVSFRLMLHDLEKADPYRDISKLRAAYSAEELRVARERFRLKLEEMQPLLTTDELERRHIQMIQALSYDYESLRPSLFVRRVPGSDFIEADFFSENPELSAFVLNGLSQEFIRYHANNRVQRARSSSEFFAQLAAEKKAELDEKILARQNLQQAAPQNTSGLDGMNLIGQLSAEREKASQEVFTAEQRIIEVQQQMPGSERRSYLGAGPSSEMNLSVLLRSRLNRLISKYIRTGMTDGSVRDSLEQTRLDLIAEQTRAVTASGLADPSLRPLVEQQVQYELSLEIARERMRAIDRELMRLGQQAGTLGGTPTAIDKEVELARDAYLLVLTKLTEAKLSGIDPAGYNLSQVSYAQPPEKPEPSATLLLVVFSGLVSLTLCVVAIFLLEYFDSSVRFPSRFTPMTDLPLLGPLNQMNTANLDLVSLFSQAQKNPSLESYKQLLRKIRFDLTELDAKRFLITSTQSGAGKTSLMVSLGYSLSLGGKRVLLIDANFKSNSLTQITAASPSLEKYLNKEIPRKMLISASIFDGMDVIGCEGGNLSPAEVFRPQEMEELINDLSRTYDYILIEGPELNQYADSRELERYVERVVPIFSSMDSISETDRESIAWLQSLGDKLCGSVLNQVDIRNLDL